MTASDGPPASRARVVVADDHVLLREGVASVLQQAGFEIVGQAGNATQLLDLVRESQPDLAIVDVRMPPDHSNEGFQAARVIREEVPDAAILFLSAHAQIEEVMDLLGSGERIGYLLKERVADAEAFVETVSRLLKGESVVDRMLVQQLVDARRSKDPLDALSPREREVLALMAEGKSNTGIAQALWVTHGTVEKHIHAVFTKLGLQDTEDDHRRVLAVLTYLDSR